MKKKYDIKTTDVETLKKWYHLMTLDRILQKVGSDYKIFRVEEGTIQETEADNEAQ